MPSDMAMQLMRLPLETTDCHSHHSLPCFQVPKIPWSLIGHSRIRMNEKACPEMDFLLTVCQFPPSVDPNVIGSNLYVYLDLPTVLE